MDAYLTTIQDLSDLELATLLSLVANSHCLITGTNKHDIASELALIAERFDLSHVILDESHYTSPDAFINAALEPYPTHDEGSLRDRLANVEFKTASKADEPRLDNRALKHVVIAKNFNLAHEDIQVQAIEIITNRRALTRTTVHRVPETFLFIPVVEEGSRALMKHLNDWIFMSHCHEGELPNLEGYDAPAIPFGMVEQIRALGRAVTMTAEVRRYLQDIVTFMRLARGVDGVSPRATGQFVEMSKYLAPLHGIDYVTPALVALAVRKVYRHRVTVKAARDRSLQYGSGPEVVREALQGLTADDVIEEVLATVPCPK